MTLVVLRLVIFLFARRRYTPNPGAVGQPTNEQHCFEELVWAVQWKKMYQANHYYNTAYMDGQGKNKGGVGNMQEKMLKFSHYT